MEIMYVKTNVTKLKHQKLKLQNWTAIKEKKWQISNGTRGCYAKMDRQLQWTLQGASGPCSVERACRGTEENITPCIDYDRDSNILKAEVEKLTKQLKNNKSPGNDMITG